MKKFFAWLLTFTTLFASNSGFISLVHAEEATGSAIIAPVSDWQQVDENTDKTVLTVAEGKDYSFRGTKVKVKFTKITTPGYLTIKQIKLSADEQKRLHSLSDTAYDITSDMPDGSFLYDLTLPKPNGKANVQYSEDGKEYTKIDSQDNNDVLVIKDLNHFTIFIVTDDDASYVGAPNPWIIWGVGGYSGSGFHYAPDTQADQTATWTFSSITPGAYKVYISWSTHSNRTTSAPYTLNYDGGSLSTNINQEQLADQATTGADNEWSGWYDYGTFNLNTGSDLVLKTVDNTSGTDYVVADEIRLVSVPDTTYVDDDYTILGANDGHTWGYDAFDTIQEGVDEVADAGIVNVKDGLYTSPVTIDKEVEIVGNGVNTIINTGNTNIGISLIGSANGVAIKNCKIIGNGDGINAESISNLTLQNLVIDNNAFITSGAYLSNVTTVNITGTTFSNNIVGLDLVGTTSGVTVSSSTFTNNSSYDVSNNTDNDVVATENIWDRDLAGYYSPKVLENPGLVIYDDTVAVPTGITPVDGTFITTANLTSISWDVVADDYGPVTYIYESAYDSSFSSIAYTSGDLITNSIAASGTPEGAYYVHIKAKDLTNESAWSSFVQITVDNTAPIIIIDPYTTSWTNQDIVVTASTNEGTLNTNTYTFTANGSFDFIATDAAGNSSTTTVTIANIDKTEPVLAGKTVFLTSWYNTDQTSTFSYADSESGIASGNPATCVITAECTSQTCMVTPNVCDVAGNCNTTTVTSNSIDLDKTNPGNPGIPTPDVLSPTTSTTINWNWTAADGAIAGIKWYRWDLWNSIASILTGTETSKSLSTSGLTDETYTLKIIAEDNAGNSSGEVSSSGVTVDTVAPVLSSKTVFLNNWFTTDQVSTFNYIDSGSVIVSGTPVTCSITTEGPSQTCSVIPNICDAAGNCNTTTVTSNAIKLDKTKPVSSVTSPTYDNSGAIPLTYTSSDNLSGVSGVDLWYRFNGGTWTNYGVATSFDPAGVNGTYEFYSIATDVAGNVETKTLVDDSTIYDDTNPTGTWVTPVVNTTISGSTDLVINTDDNLSGVDTVVYKYAPDGSSTFTAIPGTTWDTTLLALGKYTLRAVITDNAGNVYNADESVYVAAVITSFSHFTVDTNRIQIDWITDRSTDGKVIYDTVSHSSTDGYAFSTGTLDYGTTHSMIIAGLSDNTYYYFRAVSAGTPIVISTQGWNKTFTVTCAGGGGGGGDGGGTPTSNTPPANPPAPAAIQGQVAGAAIEEPEPVVEELSPTPSPTPVVEGTSTELPSFNWWLVIVPSSLFLFLLLLWLARRLKN
ncbi:MAG: hypothetical protein AAB550_00565 [Patescibacteria group bacterium]